MSFGYNKYYLSQHDNIIYILHLLLHCHSFDEIRKEKKNGQVKEPTLFNIDWHVYLWSASTSCMQQHYFLKSYVHFNFVMWLLTDAITTHIIPALLLP